MHRSLGALAVLLAALTTTVSATAQTTPATEPATLTVTGEGRVDAAPDIATIRAGVQTDGKTAAEALDANSAAAAAMIEALKAEGVAARDIQTGRLNVQPIYANMKHTRPGAAPEITGYRVVNEVTVRVRDLDALGGLLDQVVEVGANRINAIDFGLSDDTAQADEARRQAVADARRRAEVLAEAARVRLATILSINEGGGVVRPVAQSMALRAEASDVPIERGEVSVTARVTIVWQIAPVAQ